MVLYIPNGMYQVAFHHNLIGSTQEAVCTIGLSYDGADFPADATQVEASWANDVTEQINMAWQFSRAVWSVQDGAVRDIFFGVQGGNGAPCEPPMVAVLAKKITGLPGRKNRGRMYLPGVSEDGVDGYGVLADLYKTGWQNVLGQWLIIAGENNFTPVIFHNVAALPAPPEAEPSIVTGLIVDQKVATQRRRLR